MMDMTSRKYTAQEMREAAITAETVEVADQFYGSEMTNLTVKKIPQAVLDKCEWNHDDYRLNVKNLPMADKEPEQAELDLD